MLALEPESWVWYALSWVIVLIRMASRKLVLGSWRKLQIDDYLMLVAMATDTVLIVSMNIVARTSSNLIDPNSHEELTPENIAERVYGSKMVLVVEQMQCITIWMIKACILLMYHRLTMSLKQNLAVKIVAGYTLGSFILMEILYLGVWCRPFTEYWAVPPASTQCSAATNHLITNAVFNLSSDIMIILIPMPVFLKSTLGIKKKAVLCGIFAVGLFTILSAILSKYYSFNQPFGVDWTYWYIRESSTAIITANLPLTWSLLQKCFGLKSFKDYSNPYSNQNTNSRFRSTTYGRQSNKRGGTRSASQERITNVPLKIYQKREVQVTNAPVSPTRIESSEESLPLPDQLRTTVHVRGGNASSHNEETASERSVAGAGIAYVLFIAIYRLYFHPLSKYPGPLLNRISPLPLSIALLRGRLPFYVKHIHDRYGPVVRLTPTELSFNSERSWKDIYGSRPGHANFHKDPIHVGSVQAVPGAVTITMADDADHARQRRALSHAFSTKALLEQESLITSYIDALRDVANAHARDGRVCNLADWLSYTTFDIIGHLSLGEPFGCLASSDLRFWVALISESIKAGAVEQAARRLATTGSWAQKLLLRLLAPPELRQQRVRHLEYSREKILKRIAAPGGNSAHRDFLHYLLRQGDKENLNQDEIIVNGALFIIAGSETTGSFMTGLFNHLLRPENRRAYERLRDEIRGEFARDEDITFERLSRLPWLGAVLEEGLRIFPSAPIGFTRQVPMGGDTVDGEVLPGGTTVSTCMWAATHAPENFADPYTFRPERWLDREKATDRLGASNPFSLGPRGCIGRNLSYMEQRLIVAKLLWHNDLEMTGDESWRVWDPANDHENMQVFTNWIKMPLNVRLIPRKHE
ncbi:unnamed protein product [Clonostachys byssicola]|uniref:Rhodopsin domain-containing protein n=1 Tax=Clonostachys byssicola TaxID=160290 RepID=A0A9N9U975_9HYPO|nr:unnamed protein product [Clonostachys byssicola]